MDNRHAEFVRALRQSLGEAVRAVKPMMEEYPALVREEGVEGLRRYRRPMADIARHLIVVSNQVRAELGRFLSGEALYFDPPAPQRAEGETMDEHRAAKQDHRADKINRGRETTFLYAAARDLSEAAEAFQAAIDLPGDRGLAVEAAADVAGRVLQLLQAGIVILRFAWDKLSLAANAPEEDPGQVLQRETRRSERREKKARTISLDELAAQESMTPNRRAQAARFFPNWAL